MLRLLPCTSWFNEIVTPPRELSKIAPVIRQIASAIFDQAHAQIADGEGAPGGLSCLAEMDGWGTSDQSVTVNGSAGIFFADYSGSFLMRGPSSRSSRK